MIRPLRQRHRRIFITLGIFLPLAFALGIAARKSVPKMSALSTNGMIVHGLTNDEAMSASKPIAPSQPIHP